MKKEITKKELGKYYTISNPFLLPAFKDWFSNIPNISEQTILEPFAGSNNIVKLVGVKNDWACFDIAPTTNVVPKYKIKKRDTIENFPTGYKVAITNPPYLAKNSATRSGLSYQGDPYDDLYKKCLEVMLDNVDYVAAIIPESYITSEFMTDRLTAVISLTCKMFDDTECPVCLALFSKDITDDFEIYQMDNFLGKYTDLKKYKPMDFKKYTWKFNDPNGEIGVLCVDTTKSATIKFIRGEKIDSDKIKVSSRAYTRISSSDFKIKNLNKFLQDCNNYLNDYREKTMDVFLTSFKGLREDGKYRRRIDFNTVKCIMETVINKKGI